MNPIPGKRSGFTLIELLVVVAIISLLVSILLPSLTKAKMLAKKTVCATRLHNIHLATEMYVSENNGWYAGPSILENPKYSYGSGAVEPAYIPGYCHSDQSAYLGIAGWRTHAHAFCWYWPYLGKVPRYTEDQGTWTMELIPDQSGQREIWDCPEFTPGFVGYAYGYNEYLTLSYGIQKPSNLKNTGGIPYMFDQDSLIRHGGINALFPDGSVGFYTLDEGGLPFLVEILY